MSIINHVTNGAKLVTAVTNGAKLVTALVSAGAMFEVGSIGAGKLLEHSVDAVELTKYLVNPVPVIIKEGIFKKSIVTINPVTGNMKPYVGEKVAEKIIKL